MKLDLQSLDGKVRVSVSDTGHGIDEKDLPHIFDRFYKSEKRTSKKSGSTGLGLAIANKIIEAHDSTILVESRINTGTTFSFDLSVYRTN